MSRSFESERMGSIDASVGWLKASRALKKEDQIYGQPLTEMASELNLSYSELNGTIHFNNTLPGWS